MKRLIGILAIAACATLVAAQSGNDLFQQALSKERAEGQIADAIQMYERIVRDFAADRSLAARALVQIGRCYERLGKAEARAAYQRAIDRFPEQQTSAAEARARLAALDRAAPAGSPSARRLWSGADVDLEGVPSADGQFLTFVDWETGDVAIRDLATGAKRRLTKNPPLANGSGFANASAPSPDGRTVAYVWFSYAANVFELRVVGADGTGDRVVYSKPQQWVFNVAWMPDGRHLAIVYKRADRTHQLAVVSIADGSLRPLRTFDWRVPAGIAVSPDGRYIAYDFPPREDAPNRDVFVLAADGSSGGPIVEHGANDLYPIWTPDGRHVVFASDRTGTGGLWAVAVDAGKAVGSPRLLQPIGSSVPLGVSRSGTLYYGLNATATDVYVAELDLDTGKLARAPRAAAPRFVGTNQRPDWSADGRFLAFQSDRVAGGGMGARVLSIVSLANGVERELSPPLNYFQRPRWSPDGRTLLVNGRSPSGRQGLFAVDAATAQATPFFLVDDDGSSYGHAWSRDGSTVYFTARDSRGSFIAAKRTGADGVREVYRPAGDAGASDGSVSPDGRWLAFREGDRRADILKVLAIEGGAAARAVYEVPRPDMMPAFGGINWTPDGRALLFVRGSGPLGDRRELWRVGIDGSAPRKLGLSMRGMNDVRLHPDGRQVTFSALDGHSELWALEHVFDSPASKARQ